MFTPITPITITGAVLAATLAGSAFVLPVASASAPAPVATTANAPAPSAAELEFMKRFEGRVVATPNGICGSTESWLTLQDFSEHCDVDVVWQSLGDAFEVEMLDAESGKTQQLKPVSAALNPDALKQGASVVEVAEKPAAKTTEVKPAVTAQPAVTTPQKPAVLTQTVAPQKQEQKSELKQEDAPLLPEVTLPPAAGTPDSSDDAVTEEDSSSVPAVSETLLLNGVYFTFEGEGDFRELVSSPRKGTPTPHPTLGTSSFTRVFFGYRLTWENDTFVGAEKILNPWVTPVEAEESVWVNGGGLELVFRGLTLESRPSVHPMPEGDLTVGVAQFTEVVRGWSFTFTNGLLTDYRFVGYKHPSA